MTTIFTGIGFAAILFGWLALSGARVNARSGALWGLVAFASFGLAPALGLPPQPPGKPVAGVAVRQIWWIGTALATASGLWLVAGQKRTWLLRIAGIVCFLLPHLIGAPVGRGHNVVPAQLIRRFAITSLLTTGIFWLVLGITGGFLRRWRCSARPFVHLQRNTITSLNSWALSASCSGYGMPLRSV